MKRNAKSKLGPREDAIEPETLVVAVKNQVSSFLGKEAVILHLGEGEYYGLNEAGAVIWELLQKPIDAATIAIKLTRRFKVTGKRSLSDVLHLLNRLREAKLVEINREPIQP
jgi:coenzyme PQQ synthesis protein D (PqqD)